MSRFLQISLVVLLSGCLAHESPQVTARSAPASVEGIERLHEVNERLLTGSSPDATGYRTLQSLGVDVVLSVDGPMPPVEMIHDLGMRPVHLPIGYDGVPPEVMRSLLRLSNEAHQKTIYVHCHQGMHRGPTVAAILHRLRDGGSAEQASAILSACGTASGYEGLWGSVEHLVIPEGTWRNAPLPESVEPESLVLQMDRIQQLRDQLDSLDGLTSNGASTLLLLEDAFFELKRLHPTGVATGIEGWDTHLDRTIDVVESLQKGAAFGDRERALLDTRCDACHAAARN